MKNFQYLIFLVVGLMGYISSASAQSTLKNFVKDEDRFNLGAVIGFNVTQIDGDYFTGYDKYGFAGGFKGIVKLTPRLDFNMEFLYSKKGSKMLSGNKVGNDFVKDRIVDLTYVDVPFTLKWLLKNQSNSWHIEAGVVYSRLLDQSVREQFDNQEKKFFYATILDDFEKDDLGALTGVGYTWNQRWSIHGRFIYNVTRFYFNDEFVEGQGFSQFARPVEFLRNYYVSFQLSYAIF